MKLAGLVKKAYQARFVDDSQDRFERVRRPGYVPRIWCSEVGPDQCPRKMVYRVQGYPVTLDLNPSDSDDFRSLQRMMVGTALERLTYEQLVAHLGEDRVTGGEQQVYVGNEMWSGYIDIVIDHMTPGAILIEHKTTGDKWWDYEGQLPYADHLCQLLVYDKLYRRIFDIEPRLLLVYRSRTLMAEFDVQYIGSVVSAEGYVDCVSGDQDARSWTGVLRVKEMMEEMEAAYQASFEPDAELPSGIWDKEAGCTFRGKPACRYYYHCFPEGG